MGIKNFPVKAGPCPSLHCPPLLEKYIFFALPSMNGPLPADLKFRENTVQGAFFLTFLSKIVAKAPTIVVYLLLLGNVCSQWALPFHQQCTESPSFHFALFGFLLLTFEDQHYSSQDLLVVHWEAEISFLLQEFLTKQNKLTYIKTQSWLNSMLSPFHACMCYKSKFKFQVKIF